MRNLALAAVLLLVSLDASAQGRSALYDEIVAADKKLFDAFNARDIRVVRTMFDRDLEFYHDRGGLAGYEQTIRQLSQNFSRPTSPRRELMTDSLEVHPIRDYGAVQTGAHRFCHEENGKTECGVFKFVHVWQKKDNRWRITRVVSYDH